MNSSGSITLLRLKTSSVKFIALFTSCLPLENVSQNLVFVLVLKNNALDKMNDACVKLNYFTAVKNLLISKNYKNTLEKLDIFDIPLNVSYFFLRIIFDVVIN